MRGCSAYGPGQIMPRSAGLRLLLFCARPPLCAGALWPMPAWVWHDVRSIDIDIYIAIHQPTHTVGHERTLIGVGNGLTAPVIQYGAYTAFAQENGLISQAEADRIQGYFPHCKWAIEYCNKYHGTLACTGAREYCVTAVFMQIMADSGNINYYDIRKECIGPDCYDFSKITKFLMQPHVRASASCIETLPRSQPVYPCPRAAVSCASGDASRLRDSARIAPRTLVLRPDVPTWCMLAWHVLMWRIWHGTCTAHGLPCTLLQQSGTRCAPAAASSAFVVCVQVQRALGVEGHKFYECSDAVYNDFKADWMLDVRSLPSPRTQHISNTLCADPSPHGLPRR